MATQLAGMPVSVTTLDRDRHSRPVNGLERNQADESITQPLGTKLSLPPLNTQRPNHPHQCVTASQVTWASCSEQEPGTRLLRNRVVSGSRAPRKLGAGAGASEQSSGGEEPG